MCRNDAMCLKWYETICSCSETIAKFFLKLKTRTNIWKYISQDGEQNAEAFLKLERRLKQHERLIALSEGAWLK